MSLTIKDQSNQPPLPPEGVHIARCFAVIDLGMQFNQAYGNFSPKVSMGWELSYRASPAHNLYVHWQQFTASLGKYARLKNLIESWRAEQLTSEELASFHLEMLLGMPCCLTLKHVADQRKGIVYPVIKSISPLPENVRCPELQHPFLHFDLDYYSEEAYKNLPEFIRRKINLSQVG